MRRRAKLYRSSARAIVFAVLSALVTAALLIMAFLIALVGLGHGKVVAMMFVAALALLMASLVELTREIRLQIKTMRLDRGRAYRQFHNSGLE